VSLYTDSKYVQQGASLWMKKWQLNNWRKGKELVKNDDLWKALAAEIYKHQIEFHWVKGHSDNIENNLVDELARDACAKFC
jgi:ribonuclease HI